MNIKLLTALGLTGCLAASTVAVVGAASLEDDLQDPYILVRELDADNVAGGSFSLFNHSQPGKNPEMLALYMTNELDNAVNLRIPDLKVSYLVPAKTTRVHYLNMYQVGVHNDVPYTVQVLEGAKLVQGDTTRISEMIDTNTSYTYPQDPEPSYSDAAPAARQAVRGFW